MSEVPLYSPRMKAGGTSAGALHYPGGNPGAKFKSISHRCHPILVAFARELTNETINHRSHMTWVVLDRHV